MSSLDFYGNVVFSLNREFQEHMEASVAFYRKKTGYQYRYQIPVVCNSCFERTRVFAAQEVDELPSVIASIGFEEIFESSFVSRFIRPGFFRFRTPQPMNPLFQDAGFKDPENIYFVHAVTPYVFLVDLERLKDQPEPRSWADLLSSFYEGEIILNGCRTDIPYIVPLYIFKNFGKEGLEAFAANVREARHATSIARSAGDGTSEGAAIYILPWFYAASCSRNETTHIVWPEDGAVTSPMILLQKESTSYRTTPLTQAVAGKTFGQKAANSFFPSSNPVVNNGLPLHAALQWIGWDFLRENSMDSLKIEIWQVFKKAWEKCF